MVLRQHASLLGPESARHTNPHETNSAVEVYLQIGPDARPGSRLLELNPTPNPNPTPTPSPTPTPTPNPTQAAPSFFPGCVLPAARGEPTRVLQDGALLANNPAAVALREAHALFPGRP